uniref:Uncharacterized protein n=1 Tax=Paramormyrops kingsleyae TaxID=1676925 RepID=A0A3B3SNE2_9TELE
MAIWTLAVGAVGAALVAIFLANMDVLLPKPQQASLTYLQDTELREIGGDEKLLKAKTLWEESGAVVMAVRRPG